MNPARSWAADLFDFFLPSGCAACGTWIPGGRGAALVCVRCRSRLRALPSPGCERCGYPRGSHRAGAVPCRGCAEWPAAVTWARSAVVLESPASDLVHGLKYGGWPELAAPMARRMVRLPLPGAPPSAEIVVTHVPTTAGRQRQRGYDQAEVLARRYADLSGVPCESLLTREDSGGPSQTGLHPDQRRANVRGAFRPAGGAAARCRGRHVVLVDDVLTTGATVVAAAEELVAAEAAGVGVVTFARALPDRSRSGR